jgi:hypothetical protein
MHSLLCIDDGVVWGSIIAGLVAASGPILSEVTHGGDG